MTDFNLLIEQQKEPFLLMSWPLAVMTILLVGTFAIHLWWSQQNEDLRARLASIKESLAQLNSQQVSQNKPDHMYKSLHASASQAFSTAAQLNHFSACLTGMQVDHDSVRFFGNARSAEELTQGLYSMQTKHPLMVTKLHPGKRGGLVFELRSVLHAK